MSLDQYEQLYARLTAREKEVAILTADGKSLKEVCNAMQVATGTVKNHRNNLYQKLNIHKVTELVAFMYRLGLI